MLAKRNIFIVAAAGIACLLLLILVKGNPPSNNEITSTNERDNQLELNSDICGTFPRELIANVLGKAISNTEEHHSQPTNTCSYYIDKTNFVTLRANLLNVQSQKDGQIALGRAITTNSGIKMDHFVVLQENGLINEIILVLNPNSFIAVDRSSTKAASETDLINLATKLAEVISTGKNANTKPINTDSTTANVPLPRDEDIIRTFFNLIDEARVSEAVNMLSAKTVVDDTQRQAWGVQFNAFEKISVKSMELTGTNQYKVVLDVTMKPESVDAPIPYYGYDKGQNIRWVSFEKDNGQIRILSISTGP